MRRSQVRRREDGTVILVRNNQVVGSFCSKRTVPAYLALIFRLGADRVEERVDLVGNSRLDALVFLQTHKYLVVVGDIEIESSGGEVFVSEVGRRSPI